MLRKVRIHSVPNCACIHKFHAFNRCRQQLGLLKHEIASTSLGNCRVSLFIYMWRWAINPRCWLIALQKRHGGKQNGSRVPARPGQRPKYTICKILWLADSIDALYVTTYLDLAHFGLSLLGLGAVSARPVPAQLVPPAGPTEPVLGRTGPAWLGLVRPSATSRPCLGQGSAPLSPGELKARRKKNRG